MKERQSIKQHALQWWCRLAHRRWHQHIPIYHSWSVKCAKCHRGWLIYD